MCRGKEETSERSCKVNITTSALWMGTLRFRGFRKASNVTQLRSIRTGSYSRSDLKAHSSFISATTHATLPRTFHPFGPQVPHL